MDEVNVSLQVAYFKTLANYGGYEAIASFLVDHINILKNSNVEDYIIASNIADLLECLVLSTDCSVI